MNLPALSHAPPPQHKHCRLGGSAASIYLNCTKAPELWQGRKRYPSPYAEEGTLAHEVIEALQRGHKLKAQMLAADTEMLLHAQDFVDHCFRLRPLFTSMVEEQVSLEDLWLGEPTPEPLYGTVDFGALTMDRRTIVVLDFKYGKGVPVAPGNNPQLMFYALGVYYRLQATLTPEVLDKIVYVRMGIYAPRQGDAEPRWWDIELFDLLDWGNEVLKPTVELIHDQRKTSFKTGAHCRFCVGAPVCPELFKQAMTVAQNSFPDDLTTPIDIVTSRLTPPTDLSDDELGEALTRGEVLSTWLSAVRNETSARLARGKTVPGWKHVAKRAYRQWRNAADTATHLLTIGLPHNEIMTAPELKSPAQIEKALRVRKLDPKVVNPLTEAPVTGVSLVPSSHPAPAVLTAPGTAFPPVTD
jgi:hypothetical protein